MGNFGKKCQIFPIFIIAEIHKMDLEASFFQNFYNPSSKNLDLQVKVHFAQKQISSG